MDKGGTRSSLLDAGKTVFDFREIGVIIPLLLFSIFFGIKNPNFLGVDNVVNVFRNTSFVLISAVGMTFLLIAGAFDLSIGAQIAFSGVVTGMIMQAGIPVIVSAILGVLIGSLIGAINGICVVKFDIPPFITGIGMTYIVKGIVLIMRSGNAVYPLPESFVEFGAGSLFGIPYVVIIAIIVSIVGHIILKHSIYGRKLYAVGGNFETARLAGIRCSLVKFSAFVIVAALTTISGILTAARMGSGQPTAGANFDLMVIAACIIGGTSLFGGAGTILGTVMGSLLMSVLTNGMTLVRVSPYWQQFVLGIIIIASVGFDKFRISRKV